MKLLTKGRKKMDIKEKAKKSIKNVKELNKKYKLDLAVPIYQRLLIKVEKVPDELNGIYLADKTKDLHQLGEVRGEIVALGPTAFLDTPKDAINPTFGDTVIFSKHAGQLHVKRYLPGVRDGDDYRYFNDEDVIGVIPKR